MKKYNSKALNVYELIEEGLIPEEMLKEDPSTPIEVEEVKEYSVVSGDVLWRIAEKFNITWEKLAEYNKLKNPHLIVPGQKILIPQN